MKVQRAERDHHQQCVLWDSHVHSYMHIIIDYQLYSTIRACGECGAGSSLEISYNIFLIWQLQNSVTSVMCESATTDLAFHSELSDHVMSLPMRLLKIFFKCQANSSEWKKRCARLESPAVLRATFGIPWHRISNGFLRFFSFLFSVDWVYTTCTTSKPTRWCGYLQQMM